MRLGRKDKDVVVTAELGHKYRDKVSGFEGTAVAITEYLHACRRVTLTSLNRNNEVKEYTFDEPQLEALQSPPVERPQLAKTGGTRPIAERAQAPSPPDLARR